MSNNDQNTGDKLIRTQKFYHGTEILLVTALSEKRASTMREKMGYPGFSKIMCHCTSDEAKRTASLVSGIHEQEIIQIDEFSNSSIISSLHESWAKPESVLLILPDDKILKSIASEVVFYLNTHEGSEIIHYDSNTHCGLRIKKDGTIELI